MSVSSEVTTRFRDDPTIEEIIDDICRWKTCQGATSTNRLVGESDEATFGEFLSDPENDDPADVMHTEQLRAVVEEALAGLSYREREIIRLRYGLGTTYAYTLEEVGKIFSITRERVRQIEAKAVRKLQQPHSSRELAQFMEGISDSYDDEDGGASDGGDAIRRRQQASIVGSSQTKRIAEALHAGEVPPHLQALSVAVDITYKTVEQWMLRMVEAGLVELDRQEENGPKAEAKVKGWGKRGKQYRLTDRGRELFGLPQPATEPDVLPAGAVARGEEMERSEPAADGERKPVQDSDEEFIRLRHNQLLLLALANSKRSNSYSADAIAKNADIPLPSLLTLLPQFCSRGYAEQCDGDGWYLSRKGRKAYHRLLGR